MVIVVLLPGANLFLLLASLLPPFCTPVLEPNLKKEINKRDALVIKPTFNNGSLQKRESNENKSRQLSRIKIRRRARRLK